MSRVTIRPRPRRRSYTPAPALLLFIGILARRAVEINSTLHGAYPPRAHSLERARARAPVFFSSCVFCVALLSLRGTRKAKQSCVSRSVRKGGRIALVEAAVLLARKDLTAGLLDSTGSRNRLYLSNWYIPTPSGGSSFASVTENPEIRNQQSRTNPLGSFPRDGNSCDDRQINRMLSSRGN